MTTRRRFLSLAGLLGAAGVHGSSAEGALRRRRFCCGLRGARAAEVGAAVVDRGPAAGPDVKRPEFVQPDYAKWRQVEVGMPRDEVLKLLGEPLYRQDEDPELSNFPTKEERHFNAFSYHWTYGRLDFADPRVPDMFEFSIAFRLSTQQVRHIYDPFNARLSDDGLPTVPRLVLPADGSRWSHFPRFLDLRWEPSAGVYPIRYEIEWAFAQYLGEGAAAKPGYLPMESQFSDVPHHVLAFVGSQPGRWRVRAENKLGRSAWSEYRGFEFTT
jgi:hypothetical protein